jgi:hypothetical protein
MREADKQIDRFWVNRFMERNAENLALRQAPFLEEDRHNVDPDEIKSCLNCCKDRLKTIRYMFVWNVDKTRVRAAKKQQAPNVIVSSQAGPGLITVPENRADSQLTLLAGISAFGDSTPPFFISKNKMFETYPLSELEIYEGHDYTIRTPPRTFMTEMLFID